MFERRRRPSEPLPLTQVHRQLRSGEHIPTAMGLLDQMMAFRVDAERIKESPVIDELDLEEHGFIDLDEDDQED